MTNDREIVTQRLINAPRALVFTAWTDPKQIVNWFGPREMTLTVRHMDVRPGGTFHIDWGSGSPFRGAYREVVPPERLVYTDVWGDDLSAMEALVTVTFEEQGNKTLLTVHTLFPSVEVKDWAAAQGFVDGWGEFFNRLGEHLAPALYQHGSDEREIVITRFIAAPRALVFRAWTDPQHLAQWWGPHGFSNPVCEVDPRPGGAIRIVMRSPEGGDFPCAGVFLEIAEPERLVMTMAAVEHPDDWQDLLNRARGNADGKGDPDLRMVNTVTFEEAGGKTMLTIVTRFESVTDRDAALKLGHAEGMTQSLERMEAHLAQG